MTAVIPLHEYSIGPFSFEFHMVSPDEFWAVAMVTEDWLPQTTPRLIRDYRA